MQNDIIKIASENFKIIDTKERITIADSFVVRSNKIGGGNGEAKLYVGQENAETRIFFGESGFKSDCFLLKEDLLQYLEETKVEYQNPFQPYQNKDRLPILWQERFERIMMLPDKIQFEINEQIQITGPRVYVKPIEDNSFYSLLRELSLPNITYISILKLLNENGRFEYYFRLFADYFGDVEHPYEVKQAEARITRIENLDEKLEVTSARKGQGKYREGLLKVCLCCPITQVTDERILIASHIKPWIKSDDFEKMDSMNGFMLTPTFDFLFDRGFLSFTDDKKSILSPFLSDMTYSQIGISNNKYYYHLPIEGRENYLQYHRKNIFKGNI